MLTSEGCVTDTSSNQIVEASGERFVPELMGGELIEAEHQARYRLALPFVEGKRVLDAGCGTGWGSELLVRAGAREVVGLDIAEEAVEDSRKRVDRARFLRGDLQDLPFRPGSFDVVVCFEALEHTQDTSQTLDSLVNVLSDGGLLFVSSPNPGVYPAGNPFHFHEIPPEELRDAVAGRLGNVALFRQHLHLASTICEDGAGEEEFDASTYAVRPMTSGQEPYSVVVASSAPLPSIRTSQALSPSEQLQNLDALGAALTEERSALAVTQGRIADERQQILDELSDAHRRLVDAGEALRRVMAERDSAVVEATEAHVRANRAEAERDDLMTRSNDASRRIDWLVQERDRFAVALVRTEQQLAAAWKPPEQTEEVKLEDSQLQGRLEQLMAYAGHLEQELSATRATFSWRITRPLRDVRARVPLRRRP